MAAALIIDNYRLERGEDFIHVDGGEGAVDRVVVLGAFEYMEPGIVVTGFKTNPELRGPENHGWEVTNSEAVDGGMLVDVRIGSEESVQLFAEVEYVDENDSVALKYGQHPRKRHHDFAVNLLNKKPIESYVEELLG